MASTKVVRILSNDVVGTAGAGNINSGTSGPSTGYGGILHIKITNSGTGPTIAGQAQVRSSPDGTNWYDYGGALVAGLGTGTAGTSKPSSWNVPIAAGIIYAMVVFGSNTANNVTNRAEMTEVTALS